jgi:signal peptidase
MAPKLLYTGASMTPLFREGDILEYVPYRGLAVGVGDVVAFAHPAGPGKVIHRVVAVNPGGIVTKGDNLPAADGWILQPDDILGKVVTCRRQGRLLPVPRVAPVSLYVMQGRQWCGNILARFLHPLYRRLAKSGLFKGRLAARMEPRLLYFSRTEGPEWQLWLGNWLIGRQRPRQPYWTIKRPFRLFVDEARLPHQLPPAPGAASPRPWRPAPQQQKTASCQASAAAASPSSHAETKSGSESPRPPPHRLKY